MVSPTVSVTCPYSNVPGTLTASRGVLRSRPSGGVKFRPMEAKSCSTNLGVGRIDCPKHYVIIMIL